MGKKKTFLSILKHAQEVLDLLDQHGIDTGRLIQISNAQGPQAKMIREVMTPDFQDAISTIAKYSADGAGDRKSANKKSSSKDSRKRIQGS